MSFVRFSQPLYCYGSQDQSVDHNTIKSRLRLIIALCIDIVQYNTKMKELESGSCSLALVLA